MNNLQLDFGKWLASLEPSTTEMVATAVVYNPKIKAKKHCDWNYEGQPGLTGVSPKEWPIGFKPKKK